MVVEQPWCSALVVSPGLLAAADQDRYAARLVGEDATASLPISAQQ
ncbi:hypothetical protein [Leptolyngbya sp. FACHB-261]|nr:hypothetical protein [Leptolyngbya sp. FACHB-261]MBD2100391.1 hypothetical protein [Leptolyngbya sp. FACHB-261]